MEARRTEKISQELSHSPGIAACGVTGRFQALLGRGTYTLVISYSTAHVHQCSLNTKSGA